MELSISLEEHLARASAIHRCLCPRQVLGVRMARLACAWLEVDPALKRKRVYVYMENGHCLADGVIAVTCASPTNQLMQLVPYGKMAATFLDLETGQAIRVCENPQSRETAVALLPDIPSSWMAQRQAYQVMADDLLLAWRPVRLPEAPSRPQGKHSVTCERCGDRVHEHAEIDCDGAVLCKPCAYGRTYYQVEEPLLANLATARG
jgi:formylmethanofuran dehydrogenase subunit E